MDVAALLLLDPLLLMLAERMVALGGDPFVGNAALIAFAVSPPGMAALATAAICSILMGVLAFAGTSLILWETRQQAPVRHLAVWRALLGRLPALLAISAYVFAAALLLALPVLAAGLLARRWWLSAGDFYFYLSTRPPEFLWAIATLGAAAAVAGVAALCILLRTGLAVPICLLRPVGAGHALRLAARATRLRQRALMPRLVAVAAGLILVWGLALAALSGLFGWLAAQPMENAALNGAAIGFAVVAAVAFAALATISHGAVALVLLADRAADEVLPSRMAPGPTPARFRGPRLAAVLTVCLAIPAVAVVEVMNAGNAAVPARAIAITAHRAGSARAPENTLAALDRAIAEGADVAEVDAQETADGHVVLLHDTDLRRVAGVARFVWQMRLSDLQQLDVGSWFAPRFRGERIPTLRAFAKASRGRIRLNVELKDNGHGTDLAVRVATILRETGVADRAAVSSLDLGLLAQVRRIAPEIKLGLILAIGIGHLRRVDVDFVALARRLATPAVIRQLTASGRKVHVWTLDDDASIARAMLDGADNIITGDPLRAVRVREWFSRLNGPERALLRVGRALDMAWVRGTGRTGLTQDGGSGSSDHQLDPADP